MLTALRPVPAKHCLALTLAGAVALAGCSASTAARRNPTPPVSPAARAMSTASDAFANGREAALAGDFECAEDYFGRALDAVQPPGSLPPANVELRAFAADMYEGIQRYEALASPAEEAAAPDDHIAPELSRIEEPVVASEQAMTEAREAVASDTAGQTYDIPIVVNEPVLRILATFQHDLHDIIARGLARSGRYIPMIYRIFQDEGLPRDLAQVAMIESSFIPHAHSPKTAHGIWQFMPRTGRQYGLMNNAVIDERSDPEKATRAAAKHLAYLHDLFHDWYLAMAAYNAGEGKILRAIERSGLTDFWQLAGSGFLPAATQNYVPAVLAATLISKNPAHYGFDVQYEKPLEYETVRLTRPVRLRSLVEGDAARLEELRRLNPELRTEVTPHQSDGYELKVPLGEREVVLTAFADAPTVRPVEYRRHIARRGETLASVARRFRVPVATLAEINSLSAGTRLARGRVVLVPRRDVARLAAKSSRKARIASNVSRKAHGQRARATQLAAARPAARPPARSYRVRGGDTLYRIALRHGTTVALLMTANSLSSPSSIRPGDRIRIPKKN